MCPRPLSRFEPHSPQPHKEKYICLLINIYISRYKYRCLHSCTLCESDWHGSSQHKAATTSPQGLGPRPTKIATSRWTLKIQIRQITTFQSRMLTTRRNSLAKFRMAPWLVFEIGGILIHVSMWASPRIAIHQDTHDTTNVFATGRPNHSPVLTASPPPTFKAHSKVCFVACAAPASPALHAPLAQPSCNRTLRCPRSCV